MDFDDFLYLADEMNISDDSERRHRDSVHIIVVTAIVASYLNPKTQEIIKASNLETITQHLVILSIGYLAIRLIDTTVPIRKIHQYFEYAFRIIAPLGFLVSILVYLTIVTISISNWQISDSTKNGLLVLSGIVSVLIAIVSITAESDQSKSSAKSIHRHAIDFENYVYENPDLVEEGLEWTEIESDGVDLVGIDRKGNRVLAELKMGYLSKERLVNIRNMIAHNVSDFDRLLVITNGEGHATPPSMVAFDVEIVEVEYDIE